MQVGHVMSFILERVNQVTERESGLLRCTQTAGSIRFHELKTFKEITKGL